MILILSAIVFFVLIGIFLTAMILFTRAKLISRALCRISINHDDQLTKEAQAGSTLLAALTSAGVAVPSPCGGKATCKQCKVQVESGGGDPMETDKATFPPKLLREGWRLSCQCKVRQDLAVLLPSNLLEIKGFNARVVSNHNVATFIKELVLEIDAPIEYIPGDYLQFHVPAFKTNTEDWKATIDKQYWEDWERFSFFNVPITFSEPVIRAYSMASYPAEGNKLIFNVRIATPPKQSLPWGICSSYVFSLKPGDTVTLSGPFGESHMKHDDREIVFLIGGAGSSFGRAHILDLFRTRNTHRQVTLWYGARSLRENIYEDDFSKLAEEFPNFSYNLVLSEPLREDCEKGWPKDDPIKTGFLFSAFAKGQLESMEEPENVLYYICGPPMHNKSVMTLLDNYGVPLENIVLDDFGS
jgi:Na+-transporting NADH:ubiquinone oxidoreductase subunit F